MTTETYTYEREICDIEFEEREPTIEEMIAQYDWDYDKALAVAKAESNLNPDAYNPEWHKGCQGSIGVFQIACLHDDNEKLYNAEYNIQRAYEIWKEQGWQPWGAYTNKSYLTYYGR